MARVWRHLLNGVPPSLRPWIWRCCQWSYTNLVMETQQTLKNAPQFSRVFLNKDVLKTGWRQDQERQAASSSGCYPSEAGAAVGIGRAAKGWGTRPLISRCTERRTEGGRSLVPQGRSAATRKEDVPAGPSQACHRTPSPKRPSQTWSHRRLFTHCAPFGAPGVCNLRDSCLSCRSRHALPSCPARGRTYVDPVLFRHHW